MTLTPHDRIRIAAQAIVHPRTVARVYAGLATDYSRQRVAAAATQLGLPVPPVSSIASSSSSPEPSPTSSKPAA